MQLAAAAVRVSVRMVCPVLLPQPLQDRRFRSAKSIVHRFAVERLPALGSPPPFELSIDAILHIRFISLR